MIGWFAYDVMTLEDKEPCRFRRVHAREQSLSGALDQCFFSKPFGSKATIIFVFFGRHSGLLTQESIPGLILSETVTIAQQVRQC